MSNLPRIYVDKKIDLSHAPSSFHVYGIAGLQSTGQTVADEKGYMRFDPTELFAGSSFVTRTITFYAVLQCALAGNVQTCSLELYNVTDAVTVTTLTTTSNNPTLVSTTLAVGAGAGQLPNSAKLYSLRLTRTAGVITDLVNCKMAELVIKYT